MSAEIDISIPDFLLVKNRRPLSKKQRAAAEAWLARGAPSGGERVDYRKPKGTSWEEWDAITVKQAAEKHATSLARVPTLREKYGDRAKRALRPKKPQREALFAPAAVITVLTEQNPCREGTAAHAVFEKYRTGMTVAQFEAAARGACPSKICPVDYLVHDLRRGRIAVGTKDLRVISRRRLGKVEQRTVVEPIRASGRENYHGYPLLRGRRHLRFRRKGDDT